MFQDKSVRIKLIKMYEQINYSSRIRVKDRDLVIQQFR